MSQPPQPGAGRGRGRARGIQKPPDAARPGGAARGAGTSSGSSSVSAASSRPGPSAAGGAIPRTGPPQPGQPKKSSPESEPSVRGSVRPRPGQGGGDLPARMHGLDLSSSGNGNGNGSASGNGNGHGDGNGNGKPIGRGGMRGKRMVPQDTPRTKPDHVVTKQGKMGRPVKLQANYFCLETRADWVIFQYRVDFNVEEDRTVIKKAWLREHRQHLANNYLFDGSMLFTSNRLSQGNEPLNFTSIRQSDNMPVQITVKLVGELKKSHHMYLQVFNILVRRCLDALQLQLIGRNYFDPHAKVELRDHNIELWPGYVTSIRQFENSILMCAEITHKVMRTDTVFDFLQDCVRNYQSEWKNTFLQGMLGQVVLTDYNNKTYRVDDIDFDKSPSSTFEGRNNTQTTYVEYYSTRYNIRIRDMKQPLLISRPTARDIRGGRDQHCMLIPELCRLTGLTDRMRENYRLMSAMAEHTRVNPDSRIDKLLAFNRRLHQEQSIRDEFQAWNMTLAKNLVEVPGRILPVETIIVANQMTYPAGTEREADWTRELRNRPMLLNQDLKTFAVVVPADLRRDLDTFLQTLKRAADGMSFRLPRPDIVECRTDRTGDILNAVEQYISQKSPDLMLFICSNNKGDRYAAIKKKCCVDRAIPSQVVLKKSMLSKGVMSIATKIVIQLNCKIGGAPWTVNIPSKKPIMVCGYDVCHDTNQKDKSVGAFVASLNPALSRWYSTVNFHKNGEELSNFLARDIGLALREFKEVNKALPDRIVIFRDGVGEGQIHYVHSHEVKMIQDSLTSVYGGKTWKMGYIIVTKRLNTRLFRDRQNPTPGTVVDDVITSPEKYDFFLVSQSVRQGTVAPTSYNIISDNLGMPADHIQALSYKMTHLYYNWSGTVRVPAPCQYAHKLAFLVGQSIHKTPHEDLRTLLYFL